MRRGGEDKASQRGGKNCKLKAFIFFKDACVFLFISLPFMDVDNLVTKINCLTVCYYAYSFSSAYLFCFKVPFCFFFLL